MGETPFLYQITLIAVVADLCQESLDRANIFSPYQLEIIIL